MGTHLLVGSVILRVLPNDPLFGDGSEQAGIQHLSLTLSPVHFGKPFGNFLGLTYPPYITHTCTFIRFSPPISSCRQHPIASSIPLSVPSTQMLRITSHSNHPRTASQTPRLILLSPRVPLTSSSTQPITTPPSRPLVSPSPLLGILHHIRCHSRSL